MQAPVIVVVMLSLFMGLPPIAMASAIAAFGMIPPCLDQFFAAMAVTIVFGLMFATVLTTIILPVFYSIAFRIRNEAA